MSGSGPVSPFEVGAAVLGWRPAGCSLQRCNMSAGPRRGQQAAEMCSSICQVMFLGWGPHGATSGGR